jgi:Pyruvate/2-oxoacid:ferredoxin oxidoreductase gamma subunit
MAGRGFRVVPVDGNAVAGRVGGTKVAGIVLVGALSIHLQFAVETWREAIAGNVPSSWLEMNLAAFAAGREAGSNDHAATASVAEEGGIGEA